MGQRNNHTYCICKIELAQDTPPEFGSTRESLSFREGCAF
jgi:hypothetical protein